MAKAKAQFDPSIYDVDYEPIPEDYFVLDPRSTDVFHYRPDDPRWPGGSLAAALKGIEVNQK